MEAVSIGIQLTRRFSLDIKRICLKSHDGKLKKQLDQAVDRHRDKPFDMITLVVAKVREPAPGGVLCDVRFLLPATL
jgi:hypothetical protein